MHGVAALLSVSAVPDKHVAQVVWPAEENVPLGQVSHGVDGSASVSAVPATQSVHGTVELELYRPAAQTVHIVAPRAFSVSVVLPLGQTRHGVVVELSWS